MRKILVSLIAAALVVLCAFSFSACSETETVMEADIVLGASAGYTAAEDAVVGNTVFGEIGSSDIIDSNIPEVDVPDVTPATPGLRFALNSARTAYRVISYNTLGMPSGTVLSTSVYIPYTYLGLPVIDIAPNAFFGSSATSVTLPKTLLRISDMSFAGSAIQSVNIPASVLEISDSAFAECPNLASITVEPGNARYSVDSSFLMDGEVLLRAFGEAEIGANVSEIADYAFSGCSNIADITIPATVDKIGDSVFRGCKNLFTVTIESEITRIPTCSFMGCSSLRTVTYPESVTAIGHAAFKASGVESVVVPASVATIESYAFAECKSLIEIDLIEGALTDIGGAAFENCVSLTSLIVPEGVTRIGGHLCMGCTSLAYVSLPSGLQMIGDGAFFECDALPYLYIPATVEYIGVCIAYGVPDSFRFLLELSYVPANNNWPANFKLRLIENGLASGKPMPTVVTHSFQVELGVERPV